MEMEGGSRLIWPFLARGPVADMESEPTAASGPADISVPGRIRSFVLDTPGLSRDAGATL